MLQLTAASKSFTAKGRAREIRMCAVSKMQGTAREKCGFKSGLEGPFW